MSSELEAGFKVLEGRARSRQGVEASADPPWGETFGIRLAVGGVYFSIGAAGHSRRALRSRDARLSFLQQNFKLQTLKPLEKN